MKRVLAVFLTLIMVALFLPIEVRSQEGRGQGRLSGIVVDEADQPISEAKIKIQYIEYTYQLEAVSNNKGQWSVFGLGKGNVNITVEKEGFAPASLQIPVSGLNKNPVLKIVLKKGSADLSGTGESIDSLKPILAQANELFDQGQYQSALALYQELMKKDPRLYMLKLNTGNCYIELKEYDQAVTEYLKLLDEINAQPPEKRDNKLIAQVYAAIGDCYLRQDKLDEAESYFLKSVEIDQSDPAIPFNIAEIMMNAGKTDEAIKYYELSIKADPSRPKTYMKLGYAWINKGDTKKAIECFNKVVELAPADDPDATLARELIKHLSEIK
ncbi:MAG TPA: tetratricopeptide repeat protein [Candidatus Saccharicenans sp.]|nr:tetratricopeptide repeat protein [Candidatus Saccharicenans sp.]HOL45182.1 tetratricopeptide repeat protein [Candidatus Saccharicenans sp.]HOM94156.1 tetratricopeptide repeat protein [Candidatus Saccharicenans sp.]HOT68546.1 tetratricopeptide repeat protein [Candidatus Saccharicenans sp.]HPC88570.1 tetratricopeptide repeat protein [Candidatus Saccharicenans sp.]